MDRDKSKMSMKRAGNKAKALHMSDLIALGSKPSARSQSVDIIEPKTKAKSPILSASSLSLDRKDIVSTSSSSSIPSKRLKTTSASIQQLSRSTSQGKKESKSYQWDNIAVDIEVNNFVTKVLDAEDSSDDEKVEALLCGAVKKLKTMRAKPEPLLYLGLQYLVKTKPSLFCSELIIEAFCSLLKRDISVNFKTKGNNLVSVLAANLLMAAYREESNWPELFVKMYIEDSLGERIWVDNEYCKGFVENILTAFNTKAIPKDMMAPERLLKLDNCPSSPNVVTDDDETSSSSFLNLETEGLECVPIFSRFHHSEESLAQQVLEVIREQMSRRQPSEISRNALRFLVSTCGLSEVRLIAAQKLEMWIQNPKLTRPAQELLLAICLNCNLHNQQDVEVITLLVKTRIKTKPIINHYFMCMKELLNQNPENLSTLLRQATYNELSNNRNTNIMQIFPILFQHAPDKATKVFGDVFLELLLNKDDCSRSLRNFLRELLRLVRNDFNVSIFCLGLLQEHKDSSTFTELEQTLKEKVFLSITDLIVFCIFVSITASVKEQYAACTRGERKDVSQLRHFQMQVATITRDTVWWLHTIVPKTYKPGRNEFHHSVHKILFMEQLEHYHKDNFPSEGERILLLRISSDVPLLEDTLMRIMVIGLSRDHPLSAPDALELADQLVKRAALVYSEDFLVLDFENPELCDVMFNLCAYHYPENISLPQGYCPPNLAISDLYWKAWMMLLVIVSHNPSTFGEMAWKTYPMLRNMMEMCITNQFVFPPPTLAIGEKAEEIKNRELQMSQMEKDRILLFETHLAAASTKVTITEANSLLLSKLISMDPHGPARRPPIQVMEQLKQLNAKLKLGELLCHSRSPDFLLDIIQRQGTSQSMPWLSELVESSAGSFNMLPVQCLCEFLINETGSSYTDESVDDNKDEKDKNASKKKKKQEELLFHLQKLLHEPDNDAGDTIEVINYFMKRLSSQQASSRNQACRGLQMVLSQPNKSPESDDIEMLEKSSINDYDWLLKNIPSLPHFNAVRAQISLSLRQACQIENDPPTIAAYVTFLATNTPDHDLQDFADLALDMAQMIVERPTIVNTILPPEGARTEYSNDFLSSISEIFFKYLNEAKSPSKEVYSWSESQDQILIQWQNGEAATMHILVVHAMIIVLTYGSPQSSSKLCFEKLLDNWFPKSSEPPKAFLVDTSEEALLIPDWLKLRMIRSSVDVLVDAALKDLDPCQLVLFIQSFGIPVSSMSKLLKTLDVAVEFDSFAVDQAVLDKSYMSQLVEVQHHRGAKGGDKFAKLLVDGSPSDVAMETPSVPSQTRVIQRAPPKLPTAIDINSVSISVLKLFGLDTSSGILSAKQEQELFKGLHKAFLQDILTRNVERGAINKFIETCERVLSSELNSVFFQALHRKSAYSAILLRLATASQANCDISKSHLAQRLVYICHQILHLSSGLKSSLLRVATQFYNKHKPHETKKTIHWKEFVKQNNVNPLSSEDIIKTVQIAENHDTLRLEEVIHYFVECAILNSNTKPLISAMTSITFKRLTQESITQNIKTFNRSKFCFFVDWLECLNPNVATSVPQPQCQLLFSLIIKEQMPVVVPFRPYLLALLVHQSSWETLHSYIDMVLNLSNLDCSFDPSSVLDFLDACIHIPKIWQGKYKKKSRRDVDEDVLALTRDQIISVLNYILQETAFKSFSDEPMDCDNISIASELNFAMEVRLTLLMKCLASNKFLIYHSVKHLIGVIADEGIKSKSATELLLHMYLHIPSVTAFIPKNIAMFAVSPSSQKANYSAIDVIAHTLLTSLAKTEASKHCIQKMTDIDFICRKIASAHPVLLLRQLPMIPTLLRCRVQFEFSVFRVRNHLTLFSSILGLLELLPPYLFKSEHMEHLHDVLSLYMEMFQTFGPQKELVNLMNRFFAFLLQYLHENPTSARQFIIPFSDFLQDLSAALPDLGILRLLLAGACLHYWGAPGMLTSQSDGNFESKISDVFASSQTQAPVSQLHIGSLISRFSQSNWEDITSALHELESLSIKKPAILEHFKENIKILMQDGNSIIRNPAFNLMMRLLKNNPKRGTYFVSTFLQCMESSHRDVINTALEHLPEFVTLVQEHACILLQKAFTIGMLLGINNTTTRICETISLLTMQSGC